MSSDGHFPLSAIRRSPSAFQAKQTSSFTCRNEQLTSNEQVSQLHFFFPSSEMKGQARSVVVKFNNQLAALIVGAVMALSILLVVQLLSPLQAPVERIYEKRIYEPTAEVVPSLRSLDCE